MDRSLETAGACSGGLDRGSTVPPGISMPGPECPRLGPAPLAGTATPPAAGRMSPLTRPPADLSAAVANASPTCRPPHRPPWAAVANASPTCRPPHRPLTAAVSVAPVSGATLAYQARPMSRGPALEDHPIGAIDIRARMIAPAPGIEVIGSRATAAVDIRGSIRRAGEPHPPTASRSRPRSAAFLSGVPQANARR
jgi:hypothetical protein